MMAKLSLTKSGFDWRHVTILAGLVVLLLVPLFGDAYILRVASRIMILAMVAISLDILLGYGGLISFGHAVYRGIGGYAVGIMAYYSVYDGPLQWAVGIAGSALMFPAINEQRRELQLNPGDIEVGDRVPPGVALASALGSFRGMAVNYMWYRIEMLKRDGKFFEANSLAHWITTLQPRFPQVWSFHAWNMAYNISVTTNTPEERWDWVSQGIDLLREEGVVHNPNDMLIHKELAWIFLHKIQAFADDAHWHYKLQLAAEWHELLGPPPMPEPGTQLPPNPHSFGPRIEKPPRSRVTSRSVPGTSSMAVVSPSTLRWK